MPGSNENSRMPFIAEREKKKTESSTPYIPPVPNVPAANGVQQQVPQPEQPSNSQQLIDLFERQMRENPLESPEEKRRRERREKWEGIISGISDAASAVSNLITTTKDAPDMYTGANLTKGAQARFDKAKAGRDAQLQQHLHYAMNINKMKDADRNWRHQLAKDNADAAQRAYDNAIKAAREQREEEKLQLEKDLATYKIDAAQADARKKKIDADYAERLNKARLDRDNAAAKKYSKGGSNGKGTPAEFLAYDRNNGEHWFHSAAAAEQFARREGTWVEEDVESTSTRTAFPMPETTTTTKKGNGVSKKRQKESMPGVSQENTMPGVKS